MELKNVTLKFCNIYFHCIYKFHNIIQITKPDSRPPSIMELQSSACLSEHAGSCGPRYEEPRAAGAGSSPHKVGLGRAQPGTWGRIQLLPQRSPGFNDIKLMIQSWSSHCALFTLYCRNLQYPTWSAPDDYYCYRKKTNICNTNIGSESTQRISVHI